jgi:hypothetical protein
MGDRRQVKGEDRRSSCRHASGRNRGARAGENRFSAGERIGARQGHRLPRPLPNDVQETTVFAVALHTKAAAPDAAKALMKYLSAPEAAPVIRKTGMDPG